MKLKLIKSAFGATVLVTASVYGAVVGLVLLMGADRGFAMEPGNFGQTLSGTTIGAVLAAPAPPGVYGVMETFYGHNGVGTGQNLGTSLAVLSLIHISEPTRLGMISYAVFCLKK